MITIRMPMTTQIVSAILMTCGLMGTDAPPSLEQWCLAIGIAKATLHFLTLPIKRRKKSLSTNAIIGCQRLAKVVPGL